MTVVDSFDVTEHKCRQTNIAHDATAGFGERRRSTQWANNAFKGAYT